MDLQCYRCNSKNLVARGSMIGCKSCSLWLESERYGSEALPLLKKQNQQYQQQRKQIQNLRSSTISSSDPISIEDRSARKLRTRREKAQKVKTFRDPRGP